LKRINIPDLDMPSLRFDEAAPSADTLLSKMEFDENWWSEGEGYESPLLDDLMTVSREMLNKPENFGLPEAVVRALFDKPRERISAEVERSVQEAANTWAGRGFSMPPGM